MKDIIIVETNHDKIKKFRSEKECLKYLRKLYKLQKLFVDLHYQSWNKLKQYEMPKKLYITIKTVKNE